MGLQCAFAYYTASSTVGSQVVLEISSISNHEIDVAWVWPAIEIIDCMCMSIVVVNVVVVILNISIINLMLHDQACNWDQWTHVMCSLKISLARCCAYFEVSLPLVAMPFQKKKADKKYVKAVPVFKLFTKAKLRSYADSNGCLLLCGEQGTAPAKHFKIKEVREQLSSENSELVNRPAMGINLTAATISGGAEVLPFRFG